MTERHAKALIYPSIISLESAMYEMAIKELETHLVKISKTPRLVALFKYR